MNLDGMSFTLGMSTGAVITLVSVFVFVWNETRSKR